MRERNVNTRIKPALEDGNNRGRQGPAMWDRYLRDVRVMVVDDQDFVRQLMRHMLGVLGCKKIYDASDGEEAWDKLQSNPPDLLIVDWEMEPCNGLELVRRVRRDPASPDPFLPIIMVSAYSERARIVAARDSGINEFAMKPVSAKSLFSRLNAVIEHPRRFVQAGEYFGPDRRRRDKHVAHDRRGQVDGGEAAAQAQAATQAEMSQDDVNTFLNPCTAKPQKAANE